MTTKYDTLTDSEINAAVTVRVMGWANHVNFAPSSDYNACFTAQMALAAKGERYWHYYCVFAVPEAAWQTPLYGWQNWLDTAATLALDARTRCIAMLLAVDAVEGVRE